jgi:hypothetical protein
MSANANWDWPPGLSPTQSEAVPTWRAAYSDRTSALMALFCELAHDTFVADQPPADQAGDHMIWNYRKRLEEIAAARAPAPTSP